MSLKKALLHIYEVRSIYNIVNVCTSNFPKMTDRQLEYGVKIQDSGALFIFFLFQTLQRHIPSGLFQEPQPPEPQEPPSTQPHKPLHHLQPQLSDH